MEIGCLREITMKNVRRYLRVSVLCGLGFLCLLPATVQALQDMGVKEDTPAREVIPYLPMLVQMRPLTGVAFALLLLAVALLAIGLVLALVSRFSNEARS